MKSELQRLVTDPVKGDELKSRQAVLTGGYARQLETNHGFVDQISDLATYDLPLDTLDKFIPSINAVTSEAVIPGLPGNTWPSRWSLVIVGKSSDFLDALKKARPEVRVIEQKDLDLNQASLTRTK